MTVCELITVGAPGDLTGHRMNRGASLFSEAPVLSVRAHLLGLHSVDDLKLEVLRQRAGWWQGRTFHCGLCDLDFLDAAGAAEHVVGVQHPVLRMD